MRSYSACSALSSASSSFDIVGVARFVRQLAKLERLVGALHERLPGVDLVAQALGLTQDALRRALVRPEFRLRGEGVQLVDASLLGG